MINQEGLKKLTKGMDNPQTESDIPFSVIQFDDEGYQGREDRIKEMAEEEEAMSRYEHGQEIG
jgi:hypothetical protein